MSIKALIAVRSGSLRVKNKNIKPFADSSLLEIKVKQLLQIPTLDGVVVNSNDDTMLDIARQLGAETIKRDEYFATSEVSPNELYVNMAENFSADTVVFANATNPLITNDTIIKCIETYKELKEFDSVNTVNSVKEFLWLDGKAINYDPAKKPRSQDLPDIVSINHAVNVIDRKLMIERKDIFGYKPYLYSVDKVEAIDIDDMVDFEFAEFMYKRLRLEGK
ncbi:MAG: acylneuraminate cytidylyltransferase family protein [Fusobacterium sp.]|nr:acylneuraminate cytidylyltransferase family protein [Fusobacterium sp.]